MTEQADLPNGALANESKALQYSWDRHPAEHLDRYLVSGTEDPRTNVQSILNRALLIDTLWPERFDALIDEELRFGAVMSWVLSQLEAGRHHAEIYSTLTRSGTVGDQARATPAIVTESLAYLSTDDAPVPDYLTEALTRTPNPDVDEPVAGAVLETFESIWRKELTAIPAERISVLEQACGSANDYRFLDRFGIAPSLDYLGIDIAAKNIANARGRHPGVRFETGNAYDTGLPDAAFDFVFAHDLFEHLSAAAMERALVETVRVTRHQAWLHFFNLADVAEHVIRPVDAYHWNLLSKDRVVDVIEKTGATVEVIAIPELLATKFGSEDYFNREAVTLVVTKG